LIFEKRVMVGGRVKQISEAKENKTNKQNAKLPSHHASRNHQMVPGNSR
jgi:hypothetical protein